MVRLGRGDAGAGVQDAALVEGDDPSGVALASLLFILTLGAGVAYLASVLSRRRAWSALANALGVPALGRVVRRTVTQLGLAAPAGGRAKTEAEQLGRSEGGAALLSRELNKRRHSDSNLLKMDSGSPVSPVVEAWELALPPVRTEAGGRTELPRPSFLRASATLPASVSASTATVWGAGATTVSSTPADPPQAAPPVADASSLAQGSATSPVVERRFVSNPSPRSANTAAAEEAAQAAERDHAWERHRSSLDGHPPAASTSSKRSSSLDGAATAGGVGSLAARTTSGWFPGERPGRPRPLLADESQAAWVRSLVSPLLRAETWRLLYATSRDGISLASLLRASRGTLGPALLLVKDTGGAVFGAFTSDSWCPHAAGRSFGTGDCFVFRCSQGGREPGKWIWRTEGARVFQTATSEYLGIGGAPHFALWLDSELKYGSSGECSTFGSPPLASQPDFQVAAVEVWHFGEDGAAIALKRDAESSEAEARRSGEGGRVA